MGRPWLSRAGMTWISVAGILATALGAVAVDAHERFVAFSENHERWQLDELLIVVAAAFIAFGLIERHRLRAEIAIRQQLEEELRAQALHDPLTGLPNRKLVLDRLTQALASLERHGGAVGVGYLDLDGFKAINDGRGHAVGDAVLTRTATKLAGATRPGDTVGRLGGDEFVIVCPCEDAADAMQVIERARLAVADEHDGLRVSASGGVAVATSPYSASSLLEAADRALYEAKASGRDRLVRAHQDSPRT